MMLLSEYGSIMHCNI